MPITWYLKNRCHLFGNTWVAIKQNPRHLLLPGGIADFRNQPIQLKMGSPSANALANVQLLGVHVKSIWEHMYIKLSM